MSDTAKKNVVSLDDYGQMRRGLGKGPGTQALRAIRELASGKLSHHIGRMMEKIDDALFARAEKAENNMIQTQYFDAMRELRIIRKDIEEDFINGFSNRFNQGVPRQTSSGGSFNLNLDDDSGPGLVGKDELEEDLAIANMVTKVRNVCTQNLYYLDQRIGFLIRDPDLENWQNPLGPEAICDAFQEATQRVETGLEIRLVIFKLFDQHVISHMDEIYKEVNQYLVKMGVLPEIKTTVRRNANPPGHLPPAQGMAGGPAGAGSPEAGVAPGYGEAPMAGGQGVAGGGYAGGYAGGNHYGDPGQAYINALTFLQHGGAGAEGMGAGGTGDGAFALNPSDVVSGQVNILHGIKNSPLAQDLGKGGNMTIDIVAMLFDYILDDKNIPGAMLALIGRLQIPLLKVALLDNQFFSRKSHPARRLLNLLATTAVSWDESQGENDPLYLKVQSIVQSVLDDFEDDTRLFETLLEDLEDFLQKEEEQAAQRAARSAKLMEGQERLDVAKSTTLEEIEPRVNDGQNLDFVREFVTTHWKNLLFITCARQGKDSPAWKQTVATMDDLIWSIKPKLTREDRQKLVAMQPALLTQLREGMERLSIPTTERDDFIAKLVYAHGRTAINRDENTDTESGTETAEPAALEVNEQQAVVTEVEQPEPKQESVTKPPEVNDEHTARVQQLRTGTWMEFRDSDDGPIRAKLSWVSPITNTYLFTDRKGLKAGNYSEEELAELLRSTRATIIDSAPLMDRAVSTVLKEYQKH